jgi:hypothetical protein
MDTRYERQTLLIPQGMKNATVVLVGLGMLGSWTAHVLARTCGRVIGIDFDEVGDENLGTQAYNKFDLGMAKSSAMFSNLYGLPFAGKNESFNGRKTPAELNIIAAGTPLVVVSAVDSFEGRRMVAEWAAKYADLFIDTRAHGTVGVVMTVPVDSDPLVALARPLADQVIGVYLAGLESDDTAPAPACGAEGTAFVGMWVAQCVASTLVRYFKGLPVPYKVVYDAGMALELAREDVPTAVPA